MFDTKTNIGSENIQGNDKCTLAIFRNSRLFRHIRLAKRTIWSRFHTFYFRAVVRDLYLSPDPEISRILRISSRSDNTIFVAIAEMFVFRFEEPASVVVSFFSMRGLSTLCCTLPWNVSKVVGGNAKAHFVK